VARRCWTCQGEHEMDDPCPSAPAARMAPATSWPGFTSPDLFDAASAEETEEPKVEAFPARYRTECPVCWAYIEPGDSIVGSGRGYAHEECALEKEEQ
jgi:hypothetical protein